jgi:hypothetical protein
VSQSWIHSAIDAIRLLGVPDRDIAMYSSVSLKNPVMNMKFRRLCLELGYESQQNAHELWMMCARDPLFFLNTFAYLLETREKQDWNTDDRYGSSKVIPFITRGYQDDVIMKSLQHLGRKDIVIPKSRETGISWSSAGHWQRGIGSSTIRRTSGSCRKTCCRRTTRTTLTPCSQSSSFC